MMLKGEGKNNLAEDNHGKKHQAAKQMLIPT